MTSDAQRTANRANSKKSTGPKSAAGKRRSCMGALKHGLLSPKISVLYDEFPEDLAELHRHLYAQLAPKTALEEILVHRVIGAAWRLRRILRVERDILAIGQVEARDAGEFRLGFCYARDPRTNTAIDNLSRYERHLETSMFRNLEELAAPIGK